MRAIIEGKRYDTDTATLVAEYQYGYDLSSIDYFSEQLYITRRGNWFIAGGGHGRSPYGVRNGNTFGYGVRIRPLTPEEARRWLEQHDKVEALEEHFASTIEDA